MDVGFPQNPITQLMSKDTLSSLGCCYVKRLGFCTEPALRPLQSLRNSRVSLTTLSSGVDTQTAVLVSSLSFGSQHQIPKLLRRQLPLPSFTLDMLGPSWAQAMLVCFHGERKLAPKLSMVAELAFFCSLLAVVHLGFNL